MTQRSTEPLSFSSLASRRIEADFSGGSLTSDAGALLLREADKRLGLLDALDRAIPDPRNPDFITHSQRSLLAQRVLGIALGYEDLNDHATLRDDPLWQTLAERAPDAEQPLASAATLCRLENRVQRRALFEMSRVLVEQFIASFKEPPECLVLDFDATDDPVHGHQEGRFFHGYYDGYCFLPLYVFCGDQLLVAYLRTADGDAARHSRAILKLLVTRLRQVWPDVRIILRADSGFCRWRLMRWCDRNGVGYVLGLARNVVLERLACPWTAAAATCFDMTDQPQRLFGTFAYAAGSWDRARRVIVKAEHNGQGDNPRFVVSNLPGNARGLYEVLYCARGEMENRIKEQQLMLFADRTSCHALLANQFRLLLSAAAYVLVEAVRRLGLVGTQMERAQVSTIRLRLFKVAAQVAVSVRRVYLRLASGFPLQELFAQVLGRLRQAAGAGAADLGLESG
jgi:Transposase DDE domain group 1